MTEAALARHDLIDPDPAAWAALLAARPDLADVPHLPGWVEAGRPLIVRRYHPGETRDGVPLGLPLPPGDGKRRMSFSLPGEAVARREPPSLTAARPIAPESWHRTIDTLDARADLYAITLRPFGSLLWQALTGLPYLSPGSDLDLLWTVPNIPPGLLDGIARIDAEAPMRLDGELIFPDGAGINWRELHAAPPGGTVLAKFLDRLEMRPAAFLAAGHAA